ncbi:MAG: hypothetical protein Q8874_02805, partial [Sweet potato little leaf phytoplasma]|nr:hypothetical protein [Sweet potato little leaf phytoplasma]
NDALALANADVGIALQEGVDAIADIADVVLMKNNLIKIIFILGAFHSSSSVGKFLAHLL